MDALQAEVKHERSEAFKKLQDAERRGANEAHRFRQQLSQTKAALESSRSDARASQEKHSSETQRLQQRLKEAKGLLESARSDAKAADDKASREIHHLQQRLIDVELALESARAEAQANRQLAQAADRSEQSTRGDLYSAGSAVEQLRGELEAVKDRLADRERDLLRQLKVWSL